MPTVRTADGVNLSYHALGERRAQVLFMPGRGGAGSGHSWKEVVKHLDVSSSINISETSQPLRD
jgi:hypothetical protein